ncbi:VOC family protein [Ekhidna sp.]|uniref:VOC family protein n=1 Tax=Ekhidna sp. TaxID=2608089 RepID=UPI003299BD89
MKLEKLIPNLMVEDISFTLNYYHGVLGFDTVSTWPEADDEELRRAKVRKGDVEIMFQSEKSLKKEIPELRHDDPAGGLTLVIMVTGISEFYNHLYSSLDVVVPLKDTPQGMKQFTVRDVNGYYLTFAESLENID